MAVFLKNFDQKIQFSKTGLSNLKDNYGTPYLLEKNDEHENDDSLTKH